jgi:hypothetical protein
MSSQRNTEDRILAAGAIRSVSGAGGWTGVVLSGPKGAIRPTGIEKRLSQKSWQTRKEAVAFAQAYIDKH